MDHLEYLFEADEHSLASLIGTSEDFWLEFKEKSDATKAILGKEDKRNLGKELSAFANADGGVLVWGVRTKQQSREDVAVELKPIADIDKFVKQIRAACSTVIRPTLTDLKFRTLKCADDTNSGYLLIKIPQARNKPVMSYAPDHQKYFLRTIAGTTPMDDTLVRQAILAERSAELELTLRVDHQFTNQPDHYSCLLRLVLVISMRNISAVSAVAPYIRLFGWYPRLHHSSHGFHWRIDPEKTFSFCSASADTLIHPGDHMTMGEHPFEVIVNLKAPKQSIDIRAMFDPARHEDWRFGGSINKRDFSAKNPINDLDLTFFYGAQNCPQSTMTVKLSKSFLIGKCDEAGVL